MDQEENNFSYSHRDMEYVGGDVYGEVNTMHPYPPHRNTIKLGTIATSRLTPEQAVSLAYWLQSAAEFLRGHKLGKTEGPLS